ncbi:MAG: hypothetical protein Q4F51_10365, partial [Sarcina sp.]|nr:hypothetical protein [Sarcina sp.]
TAQPSITGSMISKRIKSGRIRSRTSRFRRTKRLLNPQKQLIRKPERELQKNWSEKDWKVR